jgi:hypothetical protein
MRIDAIQVRWLLLNSYRLSIDSYHININFADSMSPSSACHMLNSFPRLDHTAISVRRRASWKSKCLDGVVLCVSGHAV